MIGRRPTLQLFSRASRKTSSPHPNCAGLCQRVQEGKVLRLQQSQELLLRSQEVLMKRSQSIIVTQFAPATFKGDKNGVFSSLLAPTYSTFHGLLQFLDFFFLPKTARPIHDSRKE